MTTSLPHNPSADLSAAEQLYYRALDLLAEGRAREAASLLRESSALDPDFLDALHALVRALQDAGELDEALVIAHRLIALDPDDVLAHTRLSILYQAKGMVPEAEAESTRAKLLGWKQQLREGRTAPDPIP
jgi:DNA-binding SARP family transcriptional activator